MTQPTLDQRVLRVAKDAEDKARYAMDDAFDKWEQKKAAHQAVMEARCAIEREIEKANPSNSIQDTATVSALAE